MKLWFSVRDSGVGGSFVAVPTAIWRLGGDEGRKVRIWLFIEPSSGNTY